MKNHWIVVYVKEILFYETGLIECCHKYFASFSLIQRALASKTVSFMIFGQDSLCFSIGNLHCIIPVDIKLKETIVSPNIAASVWKPIPSPISCYTSVQYFLSKVSEILLVSRLLATLIFISCDKYSHITVVVFSFLVLLTIDLYLFLESLLLLVEH